MAFPALGLRLDRRAQLFDSPLCGDHHYDPGRGASGTVQVDRGDLVKAGQISATFDTSIERAQGSVQQTQAELTNRRLADLELQRTTAEVALRTSKSQVNGFWLSGSCILANFPSRRRF
jgi:hypothetical protein